MASGHVNRTQRPNTWLHRPSLRRDDSPCQLGAVHTWPITDAPLMSAIWSRLGEQSGHRADTSKLTHPVAMESRYAKPNV